MEMDIMSSRSVSATFQSLQYAYPSIAFGYFMSATIASVCMRQTAALRTKDQAVRRDIIVALMVLVACTYGLNAVGILVRMMMQRTWTAEQHEIVYLLASMLVWGINVLCLLDAKFPVWYPYYGVWFIGIVSEISLLMLRNMACLPSDHFDYFSISIYGLRIVILFALPCVYISLRNGKRKYDNDDEERQSLIRKTLIPNAFSSDENEADGNSYGSTATNDTADSKTKNKKKDDDDSDSDSYLDGQEAAKKRIHKRLENDGNWWTYAKGFSIFFPYVWPVHDKPMQFRAILVGCCLLTTNFLNIMVPRQLGIITNALIAGEKPWVSAAMYAILTFANSESCIGWLQFWLWRPLEQYATQALNTAAHAHVMGLSSDFHDSKESADINQAVHQGHSVTELVELICFEILPILIDLVAVCFYLNFLFGPYMGLILAFTSTTFLYTTTKLVVLTRVRRRKYIKNYRKEWISAYTTLNNWRTATYFNNIPYEHNRYSSNVKNRLESDKAYKMATYIVGIAQGSIMTAGLLGGCFLAIYQVTKGTRTPGDFVILLTYWAQLKGPLRFFSNVYKRVSETLMDTERLLELFQTKASIVDKKGAKALQFKDGSVQFNKVRYEYDPRKKTLKDIHFTIPGGSTVALVGETGSGKSTILKLLNRFYDVTSGSILIDGQDIRDVTLRSLRDKIGVVPQDPTLFNESIMNNVRYARLDAKDDEVYEACKAAAIHDKITTFPDQYKSKVGDRGLKLSGGEQQRLAIARAILKQPEIILLDEATSAIDSDTEQLIQDAFKKLCHGRTTFIVAHRLSTIMRADRIMVMKDGEIIEDGTHDELVRKQGKYYDLWSKQILAKPERGRSSSSKSPKRGSVIVNDLEETDDTKAQAPKLKPDAPEFVPRHLRNSTDNTTSDGAQSDNSATAKKNLPRSKSGVLIKAAKKAGKLVDFSETEMSEPSESQNPTEAEDEAGLSGTEDTGKKQKFRHNVSRYGRRNQTKSEPASRAQDSMDGIMESEMGGLSSGEAGPLTAHNPAHNRRVSAPSDPPSSNPDLRGPSHGGRARRTRHWRLRNKGTTSSSGATFDGSSQDHSMDDASLPTVPAPSPAESATPPSSSKNFATGL